MIIYSDCRPNSEYWGHCYRRLKREAQLGKSAVDKSGILLSCNSSVHVRHQQARLLVALSMEIA